MQNSPTFYQGFAKAQVSHRNPLWKSLL